MHRAACRRRVSGVLLLSILLSTGCASTTPPPRAAAADLAGIQRLALVLPLEGGFTVMQERAKGATAGGAAGAIAAGAAFGVLGALLASGIGSAVLAEGDKAHAGKVQQHVSTLSPCQVLAPALVQSLRESGRFPQIEVFERGALPTGQFDGILTVQIGDWGLHLVPNQPREALSGFVTYAVRMTLGEPGRVVWDEEQMVVGQRRHTITEYTEDPQIFRQEIADTLEMAGRKVAMELLYPRGGR